MNRVEVQLLNTITSLVADRVEEIIGSNVVKTTSDYNQFCINGSHRFPYGKMLGFMFFSDKRDIIIVAIEKQIYEFNMSNPNCFEEMATVIADEYNFLRKVILTIAAVLGVLTIFVVSLLIFWR